MRNIISVTGDADDAALKSLRGDWKTYSRLRGITIEVSRRVTHRGSWKWCCLNVRGRSCKSLDEARLSSIISIRRYYSTISTFPHIWRTPSFPYSLLEMRSTSTPLSSRSRGWCMRTRAAVRERINRGNTQGFPFVYLVPPTYLFIHLR